MTIGFDLGHDLDLEFSRSNIEFAISQPKMVWLPRKKANISIELQGLKCDHQVWPWPQPWPLNFQGQTWPWPLTTHMTLTMDFSWSNFEIALSQNWGGWGCEVSCGGHHRPKGKTTTGSTLDGAVFDTAQILAYLVHNMSRSQLHLGFGHFGWLPSFFGQ